MNAIFLYSLFLVDADADVSVQIALALASASITKVAVQAPPPDQQGIAEYLRIRERCVRHNMTLVVHVGGFRTDLMTGLSYPNVVHHQMTWFPDVDGRAIVVGVPDGQNMWRYDYPYNAALETIQKLLRQSQPRSSLPSGQTSSSSAASVCTT